MGATISNGVLSNSFVAYDSAAKNKVTLGNGTTAVTVTNVAAGVADTDAVNVAQFNAFTSGAVALSDSLKYVKFGPSSAAQAQATQSNSIAIGGNAFATGSGSMAFGLNARASGINSVAIGVNSTTNVDNTVSFGTAANARRLINVADGVGDNDAVNFGQVEDMIAKSNVSTQTVSTQKVMATRTLLTAVGDTVQTPILSDVVAVGPTDKLGHNTAIGTDAISIGLGNGSTGDQSVAIGSNVNSVGSRSVGMGYGSIVNGASSTAIGVNAQVTADGSLAVGKNVTADTANSTVIGADSYILDNGTGSGANSVAIGSGNTVTGTSSVVIGNNSNMAGNNTVAIGNNIFGSKSTKGALGSNSIVLGNGSDGSQDNVLSIGAVGKERKIVNVAAGTITTDAVNVGQLNSAIAAIPAGGGTSYVTQDAGSKDLLVGSTVDGSHVNFAGTAGVTRELINISAGTKDSSAVALSQLKPVVTALGGGATVDATTGAVTGPSYKVQGGTQATVGDALSSLDAGLNTVNTTIAGMGSSLVTQAAAGSDLLVGATTDGSHVNFAGTSGNRELINVAAGTKDTSAVNLSQLKPVVDGLGGGATVDATTGLVTGPTYNIQGATVHNAGEAFKAVDGSLTDLKTTVASITSSGDGLVIQDATTGNIKVGALNNGTVVDMTGTAGARKITGVAAGSLDVTSLDAINGSQLNSTSSQLATAIGGGMMVSKTGVITMPSFSVGGEQVYSVGDAVTKLDGRINTTNETVTNLQTQVTNIAAGSGGVATPNAVAYDSDTHDKLTVGTVGKQTTLVTNLTDGTVAAGSTDAVTGSQLFATNELVKDLTTTVTNNTTTGSSSIGVNGINGADGAPGAPGLATATGSDAIAMGDKAAATGDGTIAIGGNSSSTGKDSIAIGNGASAPANNAVALGANSVADRDNSVSVGTADQQRQITNVAAGTQGTDAVNLNQMNSAVGGIARKAYSGIAAATALTMIPDVDANKTLSLGIGGGTFQGYAATAIGGTARITQNIKVRVGAGWSAAGTTVGAGASYQW
jgi:autotransporter adhesin